MNARVLIVDNETSILITLRAILEMNGFQVEEAASALEAIQRLRAGLFELVITDMKMESDLSGRDVVIFANAQSYRPTSVLLTAFPPSRKEWESWGVHALFEKPVDAEALVQELANLVHRNKAAA